MPDHSIGVRFRWQKESEDATSENLPTFLCGTFVLHPQIISPNPRVLISHPPSRQKARQCLWQPDERLRRWRAGRAYGGPTRGTANASCDHSVRAAHCASSTRLPHDTRMCSTASWRTRRMSPSWTPTKSPRRPLRPSQKRSSSDMLSMYQRASQYCLETSSPCSHAIA